MRLTDSQIQDLYKFTKRHYVEWYDVQVELVDHLANAIETQWQEQPQLSFEDAKNKVFKTFGLCGFSDIVEEKTKALNKYYWRLVWKHLKAFFKLPKILLLVALVWFYYNTLLYIPNKTWLIVSTILLLVFFPILSVYKTHKRIKRLQKVSDKKWMFHNVTMQLGGMIHFLNLILQILVFTMHPNIPWYNIYSLILSIIVVGFGVLIYVGLFTVSPKLRKDMAALYPEYKIT